MSDSIDLRKTHLRRNLVWDEMFCILIEHVRFVRSESIL